MGMVLGQGRGRRPKVTGRDVCCLPVSVASPVAGGIVPCLVRVGEILLPFIDLTRGTTLGQEAQLLRPLTTTRKLRS